jgi:hypothetical protein
MGPLCRLRKERSGYHCAQGWRDLLDAVSVSALPEARFQLGGQPQLQLLDPSQKFGGAGSNGASPSIADGDPVLGGHTVKFFARRAVAMEVIGMSIFIPKKARKMRCGGKRPISVRHRFDG